jgi:protocatechuate 3,4-dioxygenase beta subunit
MAQTMVLLLSVGTDWGFLKNSSYGQTSCRPTVSDIEGPYYVPGAPVRSKIGNGLIIQGTVRSSEDCSPLSGVRIEWWQVNPEGVYDDAHRATLYTGQRGTYRLETHTPVSYFRRPPHVHVKVFAPGHAALTTQIYPKVNKSEIRFDFVVRKK